jgi:superfamily II DNA or RNA helicase
MTVGPVHLSLGGGYLRIKISEKSELLRGVHSIFFVNVLGCERGEGFLGYTITCGPANAYLLNEVLRYLKEQGIEATLGAGAAEILHKLQNDAAQLATARSIGKRLKDHPVRSIGVPGLRRPLKPYQIPAVAHLVKVQNAANFSVPGSGKTSITLAAYAILKYQKEINKLVIIGPRSSFMPWEEEYYACFRRKPASLRIVGAKTKRKRLYREADSKEIILLTYQMASNDSDDVANLLRRHKTMLVLDE